MAEISNTDYDDINCTHCNQSNPEIGLLCDHCGKLLFSFNRNLSLLFILSVVVSGVLFRMSEQIWPMYLLIMMGIIHLYAIVFTRGESLRNATILFFGITVVWILFNRDFCIKVPLQSNTTRGDGWVTL